MNCKHQKEDEQCETPEHFVTVIGNLANESEDGWYTEESYKEAVEYATSWREETRQQLREEIIEKAEKIIQEERYSGTPFAMNKLIDII